jgi:hypothetical protein
MKDPRARMRGGQGKRPEMELKVGDAEIRFQIDT